MEHMEYTGPIPELQGKTALVMTNETRVKEEWPMLTNVRLAQFDEEITFNGQRLDSGWTPFPMTHFTRIGDKPVF